MHRTPLRSRIAISLFGYSLALAIAVLSIGHVVNEGVEEVIWTAILKPAMDRHLVGAGRLAQMPPSAGLTTYAVASSGPWPADVPVELRDLPDGFHDELLIDGREVAALVTDSNAWRDVVVVDIADLEAAERSLFGVLLLGVLGATVLLVLTVRWFAGRLVRPVTLLAQSVDDLEPTASELRLVIPPSATDEVAIIGSAINRLLDRINGFVKRERAFINTASHELRTPIAVISGAADVAISRADASDATVQVLQRIRRATRDMDHLIAALLILAKAPERLLESATTFRLDELVREIVLDHEHLTKTRSLTLQTTELEPTLLHTSERIAQIAVSNLVRNAIEHSDSGVIRVAVEPNGKVTIEDPGHGRTADDVSRAFTALARQGGQASSRGLGLELIARICEHLGWSLRLQSSASGGTLASLDLARSLSTTNSVGSLES